MCNVNLTLYHMGLVLNTSHTTQGICLSSSQGQKLDPLSLSLQIPEIVPISPSSSSHTWALTDKETTAAQAVQRLHLEYRSTPLPDPHLLPHQSQSISPNGNVPVCRRQRSRGGLTGGKKELRLWLLMTSRGRKLSCWRREKGLSFLCIV